MAGITLAQAEARLAAWLDADAAVATGQSYSIEVEGNRRELTRANVADIRKNIDYWQGWVSRLSNSAQGRSRSRYIVN